MFHTPVLLLIFNRPKEAEIQTKHLQKIRPKQLFIAADGPRNDKINETELCEKTKKTVLNSINWNCTVKTLFRKENLGCGKAVSSGITWFFENVNKGIILEDDCLPDLSFFSFCEKLLKKYENNPQIMHIAGHNSYTSNSKESYFFSKYSDIWGWATWKRAWDMYSLNIKNLKSITENLADLPPLERIFWYGKIAYNTHQHSKNSTWDYQWCYTLLKNNGLAISPAKNLIQNIGFDDNATHTVGKKKIEKTYKIESIIHPKKILNNQKAEKQWIKPFLDAFDNNISRTNQPVSLINKNLIKHNTDYIKIYKLIKKYHAFTSLNPIDFTHLFLTIKKLKIPKKSQHITHCGIWKGGLSAAIAEYTGKNNTHTLFDNFLAPPNPTSKDELTTEEWLKQPYLSWYRDNKIDNEEFAHIAFYKANCFNYEIIPGNIENTLPLNKKPTNLIIIHLDWYYSTLFCLNELFPQLIPNGNIIIIHNNKSGIKNAIKTYIKNKKMSVKHSNNFFIILTKK